MKYWITSHWPNPVSESSESIHEGVYIPDGRESAVEDIHIDDLVFIYEARSGRAEKRRLIDGSEEIIPCHQGREGIVVLARIASEVYEFVDSKPTDYIDGSQIWWRYGADTETINSHGFLSRERMNEIIGYEINYNLRGFGDAHSGVKEIDESEFQSILESFRNTYAEEIKRLKSDVAEIGNESTRVPTGEGEVHKLLKERISANPEIVLNEKGLKLIKQEYEFITKDRVDILLEDKYGRFVVVEVEPDCPPGAEVGAAQCLKYRALMAFETNRETNEIRAILAARTISDEIIQKSTRFSIETKTIYEK